MNKEKSFLLLYYYYYKLSGWSLGASPLFYRHFSLGLVVFYPQFVVESSLGFILYIYKLLMKFL